MKIRMSKLVHVLINATADLTVNHEATVELWLC